MAMTKCRECGKEISESAVVCPNCGRRTKKASLEVERAALQKRWVVGAVITFLGVLLLIIYFKTFRLLWEVWGMKTLLLPFKGIQADTVIFTLAGVILVICGIVHLKNSSDVAKRLARQAIEENSIKVDVKKKNADSAGAEQKPAVTARVDGNGWTCSCGRRNAVYVSTCACGVQKRDIK